MPFGPSALGLAYFTGIKLAGYSAAGAYLNRHEGVRRPAPIVFGGTRTLIGLAVGTGYMFTLGRFHIPDSGIAFLAGLLPVRFFEWLGVIWLFYRTLPHLAERQPRYIALGIGWSFLLDLPAILAAFVLPGGVWIC